MIVGGCTPCALDHTALSHLTTTDAIIVFSIFLPSFPPSFIPSFLSPFPLLPPLCYLSEIFGPVKSEYGVHMRAGDFRDAFSAYSKKNGLEMDAQENAKSNSCTCAALHCLALYCVELYCPVFTALLCTVLYCTVLYCTVLYCTVLHF